MTVFSPLALTPAAASAPIRLRRYAAPALWVAALLWPATGAAQRATPEEARAMHDALAAASHGDGAGALTLVNALVAREPDFVPGLKLQGLLLEDAGQQEAAAQAYAHALQLRPDDPELELKVGVTELLQKHATRAAELLRKRTEAVPDDPDGFFYLAQALHRLGDDAGAVKAAKRAAELAPTDAAMAQKYGELLCTSGDCTTAMDWLKKAQAEDSTLPRLSYDLAFASYGNQDLDAAARYAQQATVQQPADVDAFALLGAVRVKLADWAGALPVLQHVVEARPADAQALLELGHCQLELKQPADAVATLNRALAADPTLVQAHYFLARADAARGDKAAAQHENELHARMMAEFSFEAPKAVQEHEAELTARAQTLLAAGQDAKALKLFSDDAGKQGTEATAWLAVGATWLRMDRQTDAARALHKALELDPKIKGAWTYLGFLALEQGNLPAAEADFQAELENDPNHPEALAEMGEVRYRQGRWAEAADLLVRSKTSAPRFLYMLTDCDFRLGKTEEARVTAESLAAHAHGQPQVLASLAELLRRNGEDELAAKIAGR